MQFPQININGTNAEVLKQEYLDAIHAIQAAQAAMSALTVHGRDYQTIATSPKGDAASLAYHEHIARREALNKIERDLIAIATEIDRQIGEREAIRGRA
jgi:hypothetical protein